MRKCQKMRKVVFLLEICPWFDCVLKRQATCDEALRNGDVDVMIVQAKNIGEYNLKKLSPLLFETFDEKDKYVVITDNRLLRSELKKATM